ncbi:hypothetical protein H8356DRAFT_1425793 [Neocallimastix lanati (nom. inval.)]|nr:hypothetical protein H8356DRAFT_1425793 [Neocallimastix sp. JGI-2020a]
MNYSLLWHFDYLKYLSYIEATTFIKYRRNNYIISSVSSSIPTSKHYLYHDIGNETQDYSLVERKIFLNIKIQPYIKIDHKVKKKNTNRNCYNIKLQKEESKYYIDYVRRTAGILRNKKQKKLIRTEEIKALESVRNDFIELWLKCLNDLNIKIID